MLQAIEKTTIDLTYGVSSPKVMGFDDGRLYVVKFTDDWWGARGCANELVVHDLALKLGIHVPAGGVVWVPEDLVADEPSFLLPSGKHATGGKHFGCLYYPQSMALTTRKMLARIQNPADCAAVIGLDQWVYNIDRADRQDNLLFTTTDDAQWIVPIDFGASFGGDMWSLHDLERLKGSGELFNLRGECYGLLFSYMRSVGLGFTEFLDRMNALRRESLEASVELIPPEWGVSGRERHALVEFLDERRTVVTRVLRSIHI